MTATVYRLVLAALIGALALSACDRAGPGEQGTTAPVDPPASDETASSAPPELAPLWETYPGRSDFEAWPPRGGAMAADSVEMAPDDSLSADRIDLGTDGVIGVAFSDISVMPGDTFTARIWLRSENDMRINLQLVRWCSQTPAEVGAQVVSPTGEWAMYEISHTFENAHDCVRLQLSGMDPQSEVYAWNASVSRE